METMTKEQFKTRWESNNSGDGITMNEVAACAKAWGVSNSPLITQMDHLLYKVLKAAKTNDAEQFNPAFYEDDN